MENIKKKKYYCEIHISARMRNLQFKSHVLSVQELEKTSEYMRSRFTIYYQIYRDITFKRIDISLKLEVVSLWNVILP